MKHEPQNAVKPLGVQKEKIEREKLKEKALILAAKLRQKAEQEKRRCKHPSHPTYFVNRSGKCRRAWKCADHGSKGCVATA